MSPLDAVNVVSAILMLPISVAATIIIAVYANRRPDLLVLRHTFIARIAGLLAAAMAVMLSLINDETIREWLRLGLVYVTTVPAAYWLYVFVLSQTAESIVQQHEEAEHELRNGK